ncbi:MAG: type II toxin-antitoxin system Phd/YefM family antitoxin [Spirochaetaceae bacterium]|nr:type II toxin-antitoxin system Phd/YefM family antitoxin [Spirochaetaceae bacterium]
MKFITVRDLRTSPAQIWKALPEEQEMILTNNGKPIALITPINESDLEETLSSVRKARAQSAIQQMQFSSMSNKIKLSEEQIEAEIKATRNQR